MKVIDLLNKIANGEEVPKEIKVKDDIYHYDETDCNEFYRYRNMEIEFLTDDADLNDEVEIIEDTPKKDKRIEKIDISNFPKRNNSLKRTALKVNEIIEKINGEEK